MATGGLLLLGLQPIARATQGEAPPELRALLEGTWELEEWHHDGQILRPPQVGGRWLNHDGVVTANFHRQSGGSFESFAGYGTYEITATTWAYTYLRTQTASGSSPEDAAVTVRTGAPARSFTLTRQGATVVLEAPNDHREYDAETFIYAPNGQVLRKYRKVR